MKTKLFAAIIVSCLLLTGCNFAKEEEIVNPSVLSFSGSDADINIGELYIQEVDGEKEKLADTAQKDEYVISEKNHIVLLLNKENELYIKVSNQEREKVANNVVKSSYCISGDESTIAFLVTTGEGENKSSELYIQKIGQEKEKVASDLSAEVNRSIYSLSDDGNTVLYLNKENVLYKWTKIDGKEKLANDVSKFSALTNNTAFSYMNNDKNNYVKFENDTEPQRISVPEICYLKITSNGYLSVFTGDYDWDKGYGELYAMIKGSDIVKIASNVKTFSLAGDTNLYYTNDEGNLCYIKLPEVNESTYKSVTKFYDKIRNQEKEKLGTDVVFSTVSADGNNCTFIDGDNNLYLSYNHSEKVKVASDVSSVQVFKNRMVFANKDNQLFLNNEIKNTQNIRENNKMIAQLLNSYCVFNEGRHIAFTTTENDKLILLVDGINPKEIVNDCSKNDIILVQNKKAYEKKLLLKDIVGVYKNNTLGVAYKITEDKKFVYYEKGEERENSNIEVNGINRLSAELKLDNLESLLTRNSVIFSTKINGEKSLVIGDSTYVLEKIADDKLQAEIDRQKKAEAEAKAAAAKKAAEEKAAAELAQKKARLEEYGRSYLQNGVYVSSSETLYYSPNYGSASGITYSYSGLKNVYDYKVSSDGNTLWLELYTTSSSYYEDGYTGYVWVAV